MPACLLGPPETQPAMWRLSAHHPSVPSISARPPGRYFLTKVNANIGNSAVTSSIEEVGRSTAWHAALHSTAHGMGRWGGEGGGWAPSRESWQWLAACEVGLACRWQGGGGGRVTRAVSGKAGSAWLWLQSLLQPCASLLGALHCGQASGEWECEHQYCLWGRPRPHGCTGGPAPAGWRAGTGTAECVE